MKAAVNHLIIKELDNGMVRILAEEGYRLYNKGTRKYYSEAIVDKVQVKYFVAVPKE